MLELTVLIISILIILIFIYYQNNKNVVKIPVETFENYYLDSCPSGFKSFYDNNGNIVCCDGEIVANKCISDNQCTLNGKGSQEMPNCTEVILSMYAEKSKTQCSASIPNYFEDNSKKIKGCTAGALNSTLTGPKTSAQQTCKIYSTMPQNINSKDSCYNQQLLDKVPCFGNNCTKEIVQPSPNAPPLVAIGFTDTTGMHRVAYTQKSLENFLNAINPSWKNQGIDLTKSINVAEVAKAYYVDRTLDQSQVQF